MTDVNEIRALRASLSGALDTAHSLAAIQQKVDALDDHAAIAPELVEELARVTAAHAVASAALRGFINTMLARRAANTSA